MADKTPPKYTTRIAPSPTGDMHLGTARTAYFNWLLARATGGRFILRIDDTDVERNQEEAINVIFKTMDWLGLDYDGCYFQSERTQIYKQWAELLLDAGMARREENGAIALNWQIWFPDDWTDNIAGEIQITQANREQINKTILLKGGEHLGRPTYQFASVVDDYSMGVNYICRGKDHTTNTPKQIAIWTCLQEVEDMMANMVVGRPLPEFAHLGLITKGKKKLSKRDGAASLLYYKRLGYHPEAILNWMLRLGWSPKKHVKDPDGLMPVERALSLFIEDGNLRNSDAELDEGKLKFLQKQYSKLKKEAA